MPHLLRQDMNPNVWAVRAEETFDFSPFLRGKHLGESPPQPIRLELAEKCEVRSDLLESPYFIVSPALKEALDRFGIHNVEWFQVALKGADGEHEGWIGNILDPPGVEKTSEAKNPSEQKQIALEWDAPFFRPESHRQLIAISDELKDHLAAKELVGLYFQDPDAYNDAPVSSLSEDEKEE